MKKIGRIVSYDGYNGKIIDNNQTIYDLYKKNIIDDVKNGDMVIFDAEKYDGVEVNKNVAMFVRKYDDQKKD